MCEAAKALWTCSAHMENVAKADMHTASFPSSWFTAMQLKLQTHAFTLRTNTDKASGR